MGTSRTHRGRLPTAEREQRRLAVLDATEAVLIDEGYDAVTMLAIAERARASKETLYSWFGGREGLFAALIERKADQSSQGIEEALSSGRTPADVLTRFAVGLLSLLTSPGSVALNRAAMQSPELSDRLLMSGRHRVGPLVEVYLAQLHQTGEIGAPDPGEAFEVLYGLIVRDTQIRVLLGEQAPSTSEINRRAREAVNQFLQLVSVE